MKQQKQKVRPFVFYCDTHTEVSENGVIALRIMLVEKDKPSAQSKDFIQHIVRGRTWEDAVRAAIYAIAVRFDTTHPPKPSQDPSSPSDGQTHSRLA